MRQIIFNTIDDLVLDFLVYDRKEDGELPKGEIEASIERGDISIDEIVDYFSKSLKMSIYD